MKLFKRKANKNIGQKFSYYRTSVSDNRQIVISRSDRHRQAPTTSRFKKLIRRTPQLVFTLTVIFSIGYVLSLSQNPRIVITDQSNQTFITPETYRSQIKKILLNSPLNYSKISINTKSVAREIEQMFPEIQSSSVVLPLLNRRPIVHLRMSTPGAVVHTADGVFVMDTSGRAIMKESQLSDQIKAKLPKIQDQSQFKVELGKGIVQKADVIFITTIISELTKNKYEVREVILPPSANEVQFYLNGKPFYIKANLSLEPLQQVGTFLALQNKLINENLQPTQYIDVRVEERAYYL